PAVEPHFLFTAEHEALRAATRRFVEQELNPHSDKWDEAGLIPKEIFRRAGELGQFGLAVPTEYGGSAGDCRHCLVVAEEMSRARSRGVAMGLGAHAQIAIPHLVRFGAPAQKDKYLADLVAGRKIAALGVTEPIGGSNVAGMLSTVVRDGDGWLLNGEKM